MCVNLCSRIREKLRSLRSGESASPNVIIYCIFFDDIIVSLFKHL